MKHPIRNENVAMKHLTPKRPKNAPKELISLFANRKSSHASSLRGEKIFHVPVKSGCMSLPDQNEEIARVAG
jgi:hypothetical protein